MFLTSSQTRLQSKREKVQWEGQLLWSSGALDCNSTSLVPVSENLRDPTPFFFPLHHSQPQYHHLSWTHCDCPNHVLYPIPCQDTPRLPGCFPTLTVESWLASEPVLSPLPIPSQVLKSFSFVLQNFVNCQHNLQCSFFIN